METTSTFIIEFQPRGIRLVCDESLTLLDAARRAGIPLRADCGGKGVCGKCRVQILSGVPVNVPTESEKKHISAGELENGFRLACERVIDRDAKVIIPNQSVLADQVLQVEGIDEEGDFQPVISQISARLEKADLQDLSSDSSRLRRDVGNPELEMDLSILRKLPERIREDNWNINVLERGNEVIRLVGEPLNPLTGLAVDVGSTKLASYLVDMENGKTLAALGAPNPQIAYGEDIMARLSYALQARDKADSLHNMTIAAINHSVVEMCAGIGISADSIAEVCLVGNTAMHHFFLNLPVSSLSVSPFVPVTGDPLDIRASDIGIGALPGARAFIPPVIAGFVGSDHLAFLLTAGLAENTGKISLGIDIGTNTEIALKKADRIVSVSTASGPTFEGAHIKYGMRAAPGAIEHVYIRDSKKIEIDVIGDTEPVGICGSGILDAVAQMRMSGLLNSRGRMVKESALIDTGKNGIPCLTLAEGAVPITLSQSDIDQVLLAKGAIRAGIDVLIDYLEVKTDEIDEVLIAGAFGSYMLPEHAVKIGMLPDIPLDCVHILGNAAGTGARLMLKSREYRQKAVELARKIEYLELTIYPDFPLFYARGIQA